MTLSDGTKNRDAANGHTFGPDLICRECGQDHEKRFEKRCTRPLSGAVISDVLGAQDADRKGVMGGERV
jgi:hypothetical protein